MHREVGLPAPNYNAVLSSVPPLPNHAATLLAVIRSLSLGNVSSAHVLSPVHSVQRASSLEHLVKFSPRKQTRHSRGWSQDQVEEADEKAEGRTAQDMERVNHLLSSTKKVGIELGSWVQLFSMTGCRAWDAVQRRVTCRPLPPRVCNCVTCHACSQGCACDW